MRIRDLITNGIFLAVFVVHFGLQWHGWKLHVDDVPSVGTMSDSPDDFWWRVCSLPLFAVVPRRTQTLYFMELLVANSALWGFTLTSGIRVILGRLKLHKRPLRRERTARPTATPSSSGPALTRADRLVEIKRLRDKGLISNEEYQQQRTSILTEL